MEQAVEIPRQPLASMCEGPRFHHMDRLEAYYRGAQDDAKSYDWDGRFRGYQFSSVAPGWEVPLSQRRPNARYELARIVVSRLTNMSLGGEAWPDINVEGDPDAQDYVRALAKASDLQARLAEARSLGGATGTACLSLGFVEGCPRIETHNAKHCLVLTWEDMATFRPQQVLKAYSFKRPKIDPQDGKVKLMTFWYARYWDTEREIIWREIPQRVAKLPTWADWVGPDGAGRREMRHGYGFTPFYWIQNLPDSQELDGLGDYEGQTDMLDQFNQLLSSTVKGAIANVDPTLVVMDDPESNEGHLQKGSGAAIYSKGGAKYLELEGSAIRAARELLTDLREMFLDAAQVVLPQAEKLTSKAQSAAAMRIVYQPMMARCDQLRDQYGEGGLVLILTDMLRVARQIEEAPPELIELEDGTREERKPSVTLPPRQDDDGEERPHVPGKGENVTLNWAPYFSPTMQDLKAAAETAQLAGGGQPLISHRSAVEFVARHFGVEDVEKELAEMAVEADERAERAAEMFGDEGPRPAGSEQGSPNTPQQPPKGDKPPKSED